MPAAILIRGMMTTFFTFEVSRHVCERYLDQYNWYTIKNRIKDNEIHRRIKKRTNKRIMERINEKVKDRDQVGVKGKDEGKD